MARIGIMSFAHMHGYAYGACLGELPNAELVAVWDDDAKRGRAASRQYGAVFHNALDAFLASDIEGVIVCSENVKHRSLVEAAARAGKWILCEKPIATTLEDAQSMIAACEQAGVGLGIAFPCRFVTPIVEARTRLKQNVIGKLLAAACTNNGQYPGGWFADPALSGGGAVMDHNVHVADALRWVTGKEFTRVYCVCGNVIRDDIAIDDVGSLQLELDGGVIVSHVASWNRPDSFPTWGDVTMELVGSKGILRVDAFDQKIDVYNDNAGKMTWSNWGDDANLALVRDFVEAVDAQRDAGASGEDGLRALEVTLAAYRSAKSGKMVKI